MRAASAGDYNVRISQIITGDKEFVKTAYGKAKVVYKECVVTGFDKENELGFMSKIGANTYYTSAQQVDIFDLNGRLVSELPGGSVDLSSLHEGVYLVRIVLGAQVLTQKIEVN